MPYTPSLSTQAMDRSVDPCVDFYQYSCGGWIKQNSIPADQARWDVYSKLTDENQRYLWGILESAARQSSSRSPNEQKIGDLFHACMDTKAVEQLGTKPVDSALARIAGLKSVNDIGAYVAEQHHIGIDRSVLFGFSSDPDFDNSTQQIAFATAGGLGLPDRDYYSKTDAKSQEIRQRYLRHMDQVFGMVGESGPDAQSDAAMALSIETSLAEASLTRVEKRNPYSLKHKMSRDALRQLTPAFDWDEYLVKLGTPAFDALNVTEPKFFERLNKELADRKLPAWRAYLRWHLLNANAMYLGPQLEQAHFDFYQAYLRGLKQMPPRWKTCTRLVDRNLGEALGEVFVAKNFTTQTKSDA
ncbi:MAG: M13 family peptidase, partial [Bryobacteraceae bacterium]